MTIRYQCPECDSVLKIKDEKAGTDGKCPKCKSKFIVPQPDASSESEETDAVSDESVSATTTESKEKRAGTAEKPARSGKQAPAKAKQSPAPVAESPKAADDDFDPAAFLMEDGPGPKATAGLTEETAAPAGPATDSKGRRLYTQPSAASKARAASMSPAASAADSELSASANARDLLSKSMDESRVKASTMPVKEKKPLLDLTGVRQELLRFAPHVVGAVVGIFLLYYMVDRMLGTGIDLPPLGPVSGTVMIDGEPLVGVAVNFTPLEAARKEGKEGPARIRNAVGITDEYGHYTLYYMDGVRGAPIGKGRLWIEVRSPRDIARVPGEWSGPGPHIREVKATGNNRDGDFNIDIKTK